MQRNRIKYLIMDVDGTMTDGKIYMSPTGEAMKAFNIKDGCGIHDILIPAGIQPVILTARTSDIVYNRACELGVTEIYQGVRDKVQKLLEITSELNQAAYIGDDINDLPCMEIIKRAGGVIGCPADAVAQVKAAADYISPFKGGDGAVRGFIEWLVEKQGG